MIEDDSIPMDPDENRRRAFEQAWVVGRMPRIEEFLPDEHDPHYVPTLQELIAIHLEFIWKQWRQSGGGKPLPEPVEFYVNQFGLQARRDIIGRLIAGEIAAQVSVGQRPASEEYLQRFPFLREHPQILELAFPKNTLYAGTSIYGLNATKSDSHTDSWHAGMEPISGFRLVRLLGKGGFGQVWEARGPGDVPTALKRVSLLGPLGEREREALDVLKGVRHPHLLSIYAYWIVGDLLVIGCELADESLQSLLKRAHAHGGTGISREDTVRYLLDAAEALDYLGRPIHQFNNQTVGIQHRDIKPANLLVQGGAIKVGDFGLAKALQGLAESGSLSMTVAYAPPEAFSGQVTPYSDQYSLGVTFCELRTGRLPFSGTPAEIMYAHLHGEPNLDNLIPAERAIVARALAKDPDKRWASCVKFLGEIDRAGSLQRPAFGLMRPATAGENFGSAKPPGIERESVTAGRLLVDGDLVPVPLRRISVSAFLTGVFAEVTVVHEVVIQFSRTINAEYVFPLPKDAAVRGFRIVVGDRVIEGSIEERTEAAELFVEAELAGHGAALVQEVNRDVFSLSVANILAGQEIRVELTYLQILPFQTGQYRFTVPLQVPTDDLCPLDSHDPGGATNVMPLRLPPGFLRGDVFQINLELDSGVPLCGFDSPSHDIRVIEETGTARVKVNLRYENEIPNRDFVFTYRVLGPNPEQVLLCQSDSDGVTGTLLLIMTPPRPEFGRSSILPLVWTGGEVQDLVSDFRPIDSVSDEWLREPRVVLGRYRGTAPELRLSGRVADEPYEVTVMPQVFPTAESRVSLTVLWANYRIKQLLDQWGKSSGNHNELREQVIQLSLKYKLASPWTSFVAIEYRRKAQREQVGDPVRVIIPHHASPGNGTKSDALAETVLVAPNESSSVEVQLSEGGSLLDELLADLPKQKGGVDHEKLRDLLAPSSIPPQTQLSKLRRPHVSEPGPQSQGASSAAPESKTRKDSIRGKLDRVRKARCQITFESHEGGATVHRELPFVVGILGNFSGHQETAASDLRTFRTIDRDNFTEIMRDLNVCLQINSPDNDSLQATGSQLKLRFENVGDFDPALIAQQIRRPGVKSEAAVSGILAEVLQNPDFCKLETLWRELNSLVNRTETSSWLQIRVLPCTDAELRGEFADSPSSLPSILEHVLVREMFSTSKSEPLSVLLIAHEFSHQTSEMQLLGRLAGLAAMFFCPMIAATSSTQAGHARRTTGSVAQASPGSEPLAPQTLPLQREEFVVLTHPMENADASKPCLPISSLFVLGARLTESFQVFGRFLNPQQRMTHDSASEPSLPEYGLLSLVAAEETAGSGAGQADVQTSEQQSTGWYVPCEVVQIETLLTACRFAQYVQQMIQQEPHRSLDNQDLQDVLTRWLSTYVRPADALDSDSDSDSAIRFPLTLAQVEVTKDSALNRDRVVLHLQLRSSMSATAELFDEHLILWRPCVKE